jgi:hypothetical protein
LDPVFLNSLRSHYELGDEPRKVERAWTVVHMGISVFAEEEQAAGISRRWPTIGDYVAHMVLRPGLGFNLARTSFRGHLTLWADPVKLRDATTDITSVDPVSRER